MTFRIRLAAVCTVLSLASCDDSGDELAPSTHRIEATRTFPREQFEQLREFSWRETLKIGGDSTATGAEIVSPVGMVAATNGNIYVLDGGSFDVVVFDSIGGLVKRFGRKGPGPGEFSAPLAIALAPDTIFVLDRYLHAFSLDGELYYSTAEEPAETMIVPSHFVHGPEGLTIVRLLRLPGRNSKVKQHVDSIAIVTRDRTSSSFSPAFVLPGDTFHVYGSGTYFHRLLGSVPHVAATRNGAILFADGADYHIDVMSTDGIVVERILGEVDQTEIAPDEFESLIRKAESSSRRQNGGGNNFSKVWRDLPRADFRPVLGRLLPGDGRLVLVERKDLGSLGGTPVTSTWDLVDLDNGPQGRFSLRSQFVPVWYGGRTLWGVERTEMGSPVLVRLSM